MRIVSSPDPKSYSRQCTCGTCHSVLEVGIADFHRTVYDQRDGDATVFRLLRLIDSLPQRFRWTPHNLIAHPLSEVLFQLGFEELSNKLHDATVPTHEKGTGRG